MDQVTVDVYERSASAYAAARRPYRAADAAAFAGEVEGVRLDLGCGPGLYGGLLGRPLVVADAAASMVVSAVRRHPDAPGVRCDLARLPFRTGGLAGVWANNAHQHLPRGELPAALAEVHRVLPVGGRFELGMVVARAGLDEDESRSDDDDQFPGRLFTRWDPGVLRHLAVGAGFHVDELTTDDRGDVRVTATRARTLADTVGPAMRMLVCGLNPSWYSADAGVGYARPGNRYWPAMRAAGLTDVDRDARVLLERHGIGMTDLVKRPTAAVAEVAPDEFRAGLERVRVVCELFAPRVVCMVGLAGWRAAVDRKATSGWQPQDFGGTPVYLMPSTSGLNAHAQVDDLAAHLRSALAGP